MHSHIHVHAGYIPTQWTTDAGRLLWQNIYLSLYCKVSKRLFKVCVWEGAGDWTETAIFSPLTYGRQRCVFLVLLLLNRRPWAHSAGWWLSLLDLITNFSGPQTPSGFPRAPSAERGFLYHVSSQLCYVIVQRPLDLWNRMFNRYQAEITVIQFRGQSLPVRQSMSVPWEFFYIVPFHQPISAHAISSHNCYWNVSLPSGASPWNGIFGWVKGQNTTLLLLAMG